MASADLRGPGAILLISCYELGHQPIGLASPRGFLERAGFVAEAIDIAAERLDRGKIERARFIGISVPMHTALRLGVRVMERIRAINPGCHLCVYGLYASLNASHLWKRGADTVIGGEYEEALVALIERLDQRGLGDEADVPGVSRADRPALPVLRRLPFATPARGGLKPLDAYVRVEGGGLEGPAGYVEATRGCLHRCRHCPITPVYDGRFFAVPLDVVLSDIRQQVKAGATHITFGDPDFLNGPGHARRLAEAVHAEFPGLSFDITTKVEHILEHRAMLPELRRLGCAFAVSAFESLSDTVLTHLDKGHTRKDTWTALQIAREAGIALRPTWVPFTPWATIEDILEILSFVEDHGLIDCVLPVQYAIRLLVPPGSALLALPAMRTFLGPLDEAALTYVWTHPDPRMDRLARAIAAAVAAATEEAEDADATFHRVKQIAFDAAGEAETGAEAQEACEGAAAGAHRSVVLLSGAHRGPGWSSPRGVREPWPLATPTPPWYGAPVFTPPRFPHEFNLADYFLFNRLAEGLGDKVAILFGDLRQTYAEVAERARSLRAFLTMTGLAREERVLIALHDTPAFVWAFFATLHHGAVVAMANPDAPSADLAYLVEYTRAAVVITNPRTAESIYPALAVASLRALILVPEVPTGGDVEGDPWSLSDARSLGPSSMPSSWSLAGPVSAAAISSPSSIATPPVRLSTTPAPMSSPPSSDAPAAALDTMPPPAIRGEPSSTTLSTSPEPTSSLPATSAVREITPESPFSVPYRSVATLSPIALRDAIEHGRASAPHQAPPRRTKRDDVAIWLFTSGSTGRSKAALHSHRDFAYNTECYAKNTLGYRRDDITVSVSRLFFGYATGTNLMFPFAVGGATGLFAERPTPETLSLAIAQYRPTVVTNVPTMMMKLLEHDDARAAEGRPRLDFSSVRFHLSAGEALPPALLERFRERFQNDVYDGIGSAEMFHIYCTNRPGDIKPGSLGRVVDGYEIKILRAEATGPGEPELPPGETGVMWVKGDSVAIGYFQDREKSWATFFGHWCRTGDLFRLDEEGYLWFSGRADDLLKVGGVWVSPVEVEDCLTKHPAVALAAVIGAEEEGLTKPKAFVVIRDEAKGSIATEEGQRELAAELKSHVKYRLSKHKYPRWVVFVDDVPKNDRGKVDRKALKSEESQGKNPAGH